MSALYQTDHYTWLHNQINCIQKRELDGIDWNHLVEELQAMGRSEYRAIESYIEVVLVHLLKIQYKKDPLCLRVWELSVKHGRLGANNNIEDNSGIKSKLNTMLKSAYSSARLMAAAQTGSDENDFPENCPWDLNTVLGEVK